MTERVTDFVFADWFVGMCSEKWDAVLFSGGGNDMIDAALSTPTSDLSLRLLRRPDEWPTTRSKLDHVHCASSGRLVAFPVPTQQSTRSRRSRGDPYLRPYHSAGCAGGSLRSVAFQGDEHALQNSEPRLERAGRRVDKSAG